MIKKGSVCLDTEYGLETQKRSFLVELLILLDLEVIAMCSQKFLIALLFTGLVTVTAAKQDDFAIVRENVRKIMLWPTLDQLPDVIAQAVGNLSALDENTCQWPDLNYSTRGPENWDPVLHMFRVSTMTAALTAPGGMPNNTQLSFCY